MKKSLSVLVLGLSMIAPPAMKAAHGAEVAKVNGRSIDAQEIREALSNLNEGQRDSVLRDINSRRQILSNLVDREILSQEAEKAKLDQDAEYKQAMAQFRKQYLATKLIERNLTAKMTEKAAKKYYEAHKSRYSTDSVRVHHILLEDEAKAQNMLRLAKAKGADFQALAEKHSKDPSAKNNRGDIGIVMRDSPFVAEFKDAAFAGGAGDIVGPVKTTYGYHVIKIIDKKIGKPLSYDEVELRVKDDLRQDLIQTYLGRLKRQAKIQVNDKALNAM